MKARLKPRHVMSNKQRRAADEYVRENQADIIRRIFKILAIVLNEQYGFGKMRTGRILAAVNEAAADQQHDEVFWSHVDARVKQLGFDFEDEDWKEGFS